MRFQNIRSAQNPIIKRARKLATSNRFCKLSGLTLAEGIHLAKELASIRELLVRIYLCQGAKDNPEIKDIIDSFRTSEICVFELPTGIFNHICPVDNSTGIICEIRIPNEQNKSIQGDIVFLDGVQDPGNLGTILRTCLAAGVKNVALSKDCTFAWSPKALRAGMGAQFLLQLHEPANINDLKANTGNQCLVTALQGGKDLFSEAWGDRSTIWVFGNEGKGVSKETISAADKILFIPISSVTESLNVAAASAICLFEQKRRRLKYHIPI